MTIYLPEGTDKTKCLDLSSTQFSLTGTTLSITPGGIYAFASDAEMITGTLTDKMANPANVQAKLNNVLAGYAAIGTTPVILDAAVQSTTVGNTANETTLYTFAIPAGTMGTANALKLTIIGTWKQNASKHMTIKLIYGATTVATITDSAYENSATTFNFKIEAYLCAQGATNAQFGTIHYRTGLKDSDSMDCGAQGTSTEDSTGALNLVVTCKWDGASADATLTSKYAILEKIIGV